MKKRLAGLLGIGALAGAVFLGYAAGGARAGGIPSPNPLTYSGTLTDTTGAPQAGKSVLVSLYTKAAPGTGTAQCTTTSPAITDANGRFNLPLPDKCTSAVNVSPDVWAQLNVDGADLPFRIKVGAVPYAVAALRTTISRNGKQYSDGATHCGSLPATTGSITNGTDHGFIALKTLCENKCGPGAHVCSADEVVRGASLGVLPSAQSWFATGTRFNDGAATLTDCDQFTSSDATAFGETVDQTGNVVSAACSTSLAVACCD